MGSSLEGVRILEMAHQYPGPYCSMLLADLGAEVVKVEMPGVGDLARQLPHFFQSINRNKKSLTLNLKAPAAKKILYQLVEIYNVFTEGFRPGVVNRLGIDYETLRIINPRLIYCSISGYGQEGPYKNLPGHDLNYQAMAGMLQCFQNGEGNFITPQVAIGDLSSGMFAAIAILAALRASEKNGQGQYIDVSMFDGLLSWLSTNFGNFFGTGQFGGIQDAGYGIFRAGDGLSFALGIAHEDWFWDRLCSAIGLDECRGIRAVDRRNRKRELVEKLQSVFVRKKREEWMRVLTEADVPASPIHTPDQVVKDPHVIFREMIQEISLPSGERIKQVGFPVKLSLTPGRVQTASPELGKDTDQILRSLGYSKKDIDGFRKDAVV